MKNSTVLVIGGWHLGSVIAACLAKANNDVSVWDQSTAVAESWKDGKPPIFEPGLTELVSEHFSKTLHWVNGDPSVAAKNSNWIVLAYDTPVDEGDIVDLSSVEEGFKQAIRNGFSNSTTFFFTAQVPVGTSKRLRNLILQINPSWTGNVLFMPENLRLGQALQSFQNPDRMVLGVDSVDSAVRDQMLLKFRELISNSTTPIQIMGLESAEMVKHALNSFLGTCVVFANEISDVCEVMGANAWEVMASLRQDSRVGPKAFLRPGLGFAGGTIGRDVKILSRPEFSGSDGFFSKIYQLNTQRNAWIVKSLENNLKTLENKKVVLLGITYKPFTSTVRRSPAMEIASLLMQRGASCVAMDPMADLDELSDERRKTLPFQFETNLDRAFQGADAAVLLTEWPQFLDLDWNLLVPQMRNALLIDSKNLFDGKTPSALKRVVPGRPL